MVKHCHVSGVGMCEICLGYPVALWSKKTRENKRYHVKRTQSHCKGAPAAWSAPVRTTKWQWLQWNEAGHILKNTYIPWNQNEMDPFRKLSLKISSPLIVAASPITLRTDKKGTDKICMLPLLYKLYFRVIKSLIKERSYRVPSK